MRKPCTIPGCDNPAHSRDYCRLHFNRFRATGDPLKTKIASIPRGAARNACAVADCTETVHSRGWCSKHYQRWKFAGDPLKTLKPPKGEGQKYRGGKPYYVWLWEQHNGPVPKGSHVHHKDHDRSHDVIENLELLTHSEHATHHHRDRLIKQNIANTIHQRCFVDECVNTKGLCKGPDGNGYCPTHRQQMEVHGRITSRIPLNHSERTRAAWQTKKEKISTDKPDGYLKHKRNSRRYSGDSDH